MLVLKNIKTAHPLLVIIHHYIDGTSVLRGKLVDSYLQCTEDEVGFLIPVTCRREVEKLYKEVSFNPFLRLYREVYFSNLLQDAIMKKLDEGQVTISDWKDFAMPVI